MSLYQDLSVHYDEVFAVSEAELAFVTKSLPEKAILLDVGCGTGNKTILLGQHAAKVVGVDPDGAMIAKANADNKKTHMEYTQAAMEDLAGLFPPGSFTAITCLGNTLVHLTNRDDIARVIRALYGLLQNDGVFIGQILNYDYIFTHKITALPVLETRSVRFTRQYDLSQIPIQFITQIQYKKSGETLYNHTPLYPLRKNELQEMLVASGFRGIEFFGSYAGDPLAEDSLPLIVRCQK